MRATPRQNTYLHRYRFVPSQIDAAASPRLKLVVVIPCHDEPDLLVTLDDLWACDRPSNDVEVLVVINGADTDTRAVRVRNGATLAATRAWIFRHWDPQLRFHVP